MSTQEPTRPDSVRQVILTNGMIALVDEADYELVSQFSWQAIRRRSTTYAMVSNRRAHGTLMHRLILNAPKGMLVDHRDGNGLNNTRANIRLATYSTNAQNGKPHRDSKHRFRGTYKQTGANGWYAKICVNRKIFYLGSFRTEEEAARAYNEAAKRLHGEFARLNEL